MVKGKKNDHGRSFKRTKKQWENSIGDHIGKIIDNSNLHQVLEFGLNVALAIQGYIVTDRIEGALIGPVSLKLAQSENLVAGTAGVAGLGLLGLASISTDINKPFFLLGEVPAGYETYWIAPFIYGTRPIKKEDEAEEEIPDFGTEGYLKQRFP